MPRSTRVGQTVMVVDRRQSGSLGIFAMAIGCVVSGLVFLIVPEFEDPQFAALTHLSGDIEAVRRISAPGSTNPSVSLVLSNSSGQHEIRIETYKAHPTNLARLSLGESVDAWVDHDPTGAMFAWQIERNGEVLVGYKDRLESSWRLQQRISFVGWPLLAAGILLVVLGIRRIRAQNTLGQRVAKK